MIKMINKKPKLLKKLTLFATIFALIFNITLGPLVANVSATSYIAAQTTNSTIKSAPPPAR
jgi:hypothetical protein